MSAFVADVMHTSFSQRHNSDVSGSSLKEVSSSVIAAIESNKLSLYVSASEHTNTEIDSFLSTVRQRALLLQGAHLEHFQVLANMTLLANAIHVLQIRLRRKVDQLNANLAMASTEQMDPGLLYVLRNVLLAPLALLDSTKTVRVKNAWLVLSQTILE